MRLAYLLEYCRVTQKPRLYILDSASGDNLVLELDDLLLCERFCHAEDCTKYEKDFLPPACQVSVVSFFADLGLSSHALCALRLVGVLMNVFQKAMNRI